MRILAILAVMALVTGCATTLNRRVHIDRSQDLGNTVDAGITIGLEAAESQKRLRARLLEKLNDRGKLSSQVLERGREEREGSYPIGSYQDDGAHIAEILAGRTKALQAENDYYRRLLLND